MRPHLRAPLPHRLRVLLSLVGLLAVAACNSSGDATSGIDYYSPGSWHHVGAVSGTTLNGKPFSLSAFAGNIVVVNFWGAWCSPCRAEQSTLEEVAKAQRSKNVKFLGIDVEDTRANALAFLRTHPSTYPSLFDYGATLGLDFTDAEPTTTPTTFVLTPQGDIAARASGSLLYSQLTEMIAHVRAEL